MKKEIWWCLWHTGENKIHIVRQHRRVLPSKFPSEEIRRVELRLLPKKRRKT